MKYLLMVFLLLATTSIAFAQNDGIDDEKAVKLLSYILDGESAARLHLADLRRIAAATPYKPLAVVVVSHQLLVWGWKDFESKNIIKACANAAAGVGADDEGFARIALTVGRLTDSEQSTYAAFSSLENEGIPAWQIVAFAIGRSVEESKKLSQQDRLKPRGMADALTALFGEKYAGAAEREAKKARGEKSAPVPPSQSSVQAGYQAEITGTRLIDWVNPQGQWSRMVLVNWKNIGAQPIGQVKATITCFDARGRQIYEAKDYNIFVTYDQKKMIDPGKTYAEPDGEGHICLPPDGSRAVTAKAVLTKVAGLPPK